MSRSFLPSRPTRSTGGFYPRPVHVGSRIVLAGLALMLSACGAGDAVNANSQPHSSPTEPSAGGPAGSPIPTIDPSSHTSGCHDASSLCLGLLGPGTFHSQHIDVFGTSAAGQLTYTVGSGWANALDHVPSYWLRPQADYLAADWDTTTSGIYIWANVAAAKQVNTCPEESDTKVGTGAASIARWLSGLPGLSVKRQPSTSIDGHRAVVLDVRVSSTSALCGSYAPLLANRPGVTDTWVNGISTSEAQRLMLMHLPGGHTTEVVVAGPRPRFKELVASSRPVIASLHFTH